MHEWKGPASASGGGVFVLGYADEIWIFLWLQVMAICIRNLVKFGVIFRAYHKY